MKININKKEGLLFVGAILVVSIFQVFTNANEILRAPSFESLNSFNGYVVEVWRGNRDNSFWVSASNDVEKITVYVPENCGCNFEKKIQVGNTIQIGSYRSSFLSSIRAWSIRSNDREVINYEKSLALHTGGERAIIMVFFSVILLFSAIVAMVLLLITSWARKYIVKKK